MKGKNLVFALMTLLLICMIGFCIAGTVRGQESPGQQVPESWFRTREAELLRDVRMYLEQSGYRNSGVTLTRVVDEEGNRHYTFTVHHARIDRMEESDRQALGRELALLCPDGKSVCPGIVCSFACEFLILDGE